MGDIFYKITKFGLVGFSGVLIDFGTTYWLKEKEHTNKYLANAVGFFFAVSSNFILNKIWTFKNTQVAFLSQYIIYFCIALGGLAINQLVLYIAHRYFNIRFYPAKGIATILVIVWNFTLNYAITFSQY